MVDYSGKRFLVVDDFSDFLGSVKAMLRQMGAQDIDTADRGEETLKLCRSKRYDIVLHDYNLGSGKNGQQVLEELVAGKLLSPHSIFVMVTAESSQAMVLGALEHEPDAYLTKPFNRASLAQRLDKLVERKERLKPIYSAMEKHDPAAALDACDRLIAEDKRYAQLCLRLKANALQELHRLDELETLLNGVLADRPLPWAYLALGSLLLSRGALERAQSVYEQSIRSFPMLPPLYDGLAAVHAAQGDSQKAQNLLEDAVRLSPLSIRRQMQLGKLAKLNEDFSSASKAYRHAVDLGRNSCFKSPENYLNLTGALLAQAGDGPLEKRAQTEISQALGELDKGYAENQAVIARARLAQAKTLAKVGDKAGAEKLAREAIARLGELDEFFAADAAMEVAGQLRELGHGENADALLSTCVEMYGDDPGVMQRIAKQTEDPAILSRGKEAVELNRQGVRCYQKGQLEQALELFRQAWRLQPKNISLALNTAQSLLRLAGNAPNPALREECQNCLDQVKMIPSGDHRYERYQLLRRKALNL